MNREQIRHCLHRQRSAAGFSKAAGNGQAKAAAPAGAGVRADHKGLKDLSRQLRRDAGAVVADPQGDL